MLRTFYDLKKILFYNYLALLSRMSICRVKTSFSALKKKTDAWTSIATFIFLNCVSMKIAFEFHICHENGIGDVMAGCSASDCKFVVLSPAIAAYL